jgi:hypothetical protein
MRRTIYTNILALFTCVSLFGAASAQANDVHFGLPGTGVTHHVSPARGVAKRHLAKRHLDKRHLAKRHLAKRHLA